MSVVESPVWYAELRSPTDTRHRRNFRSAHAYMRSVRINLDRITTEVPANRTKEPDDREATTARQGTK